MAVNVSQGPADSVCPFCGRPNDGHAGHEKGRMRPGDISICVYCTALSILGDDERPRKMTENEHDDLVHSASWPKVLLYVEKVKEMRSKRED